MEYFFLLAALMKKSAAQGRRNPQSAPNRLPNIRTCLAGTFFGDRFVGKVQFAHIHAVHP